MVPLIISQQDQQGPGSPLHVATARSARSVVCSKPSTLPLVSRLTLLTQRWDGLGAPGKLLVVPSVVGMEGGDVCVYGDASLGIVLACHRLNTDTVLC